MPTTGAEEAESSSKWRHRKIATRLVVLFSDATCHPKMTLEEALGGTAEDISNLILTNKTYVFLFAPDHPCYEALEETDTVFFTPIGKVGGDTQKAMKDFVEDETNFKSVLERLAATITKTVQAEKL